MADLFAPSSNLPAAVEDGWHKPRPWQGCDTSSVAWRDYCEAWTLYHRHYNAREAEWEWRMGEYMRRVTKARGAKGADIIRHNIVIVVQDMRGLIADRSALPEMLQ